MGKYTGQSDWESLGKDNLYIPDLNIHTHSTTVGVAEVWTWLRLWLLKVSVRLQCVVSSLDLFSKSDQTQDGQVMAICTAS